MHLSSDAYNLIGATGASLILLGFYRVSIGKWTNRSFWYELDNIIGPLLLIIYQLHLHAYITLILNVIWAIVAFRGITSYAERARQKKRKARSKR